MNKIKKFAVKYGVWGGVVIIIVFFLGYAYGFGILVTTIFLGDYIKTQNAIYNYSFLHNTLLALFTGVVAVPFFLISVILYRLVLSLAKREVENTRSKKQRPSLEENSQKMNATQSLAEQAAKMNKKWLEAHDQAWGDEIVQNANESLRKQRKIGQLQSKAQLLWIGLTGTIKQRNISARLFSLVWKRKY